MVLTISALALAGCGGGGDSEPAPAETAPAAAAEQGAEPASSAQVSLGDLGPCGNQPRPDGFRCGEIEVPFERSDPSYGTTTIGFAVRPREDVRHPSQGAIFAVEGGPGYSSTGTANAFSKLFEPLLRHHDLVLVDQRGQGRSELYDCPDLQRGAGPDWLTLAECARRLGKRFISYRTSAAADDIDDVRAALGYERIALYGDSYGSFLGQSYAYRHGDRLQALVLDSTYPAFGEDPWYPSLPKTAVRSLDIACDRSPDCSGDARTRLGELVDYLRQTRRGTGDLLDVLAKAGYGPPDTYLKIDRVGAKLLEGERGPWHRLVRDEKPGAHHIRSYARAGELVVGCNDYPMIWEKDASEAQRRHQLEQAIRDYDPNAFPPFTPREMALSTEIGYLECLTWPRPTDVYEPAVDPETQEPTEAPVLVVSGELDNVTTPEEGDTVAGFFPNSEYYLARSAGHTHALYYKNSAAADRIREFLREQLGAETG